MLELRAVNLLGELAPRMDAVEAGEVGGIEANPPRELRQGKIVALDALLDVPVDLRDDGLRVMGVPELAQAADLLAVAEKARAEALPFDDAALQQHVRQRANLLLPRPAFVDLAANLKRQAEERQELLGARRARLAGEGFAQNRGGLLRGPGAQGALRLLHKTGKAKLLAHRVALSAEDALRAGLLIGHDEAVSPGREKGAQAAKQAVFLRETRKCARRADKEADGRVLRLGEALLNRLKHGVKVALVALLRRARALDQPDEEALLRQKREEAKARQPQREQTVDFQQRRETVGGGSPLIPAENQKDGALRVKAEREAGKAGGDVLPRRAAAQDALEGGTLQEFLHLAVLAAQLALLELRAGLLLAQADFPVDLSEDDVVALRLEQVAVVQRRL